MQSQIICLVFLYSAVKTIFSINSQMVSYYEQLIKENTKEAESYQNPTCNCEFKGGFESSEIKDVGVYDFIIVGAGSAGSVMATRLSEIDNWNILLLEAGGEETDFSRIPSMVFPLINSNMSWGYFSTPQKNSCMGMKDNRCRLPRGKSLGGSSAINGLQYVRGNARDYDQWEVMGNPGWSYANVLPYFIKSENSEIDGDPGYHGNGGLLNVEYGYTAPISSIFSQANKELNRPKVDFNGRSQMGYSKPQATMKEGRRHSAATAFLERARNRKNLKVITRALATEIIIDEFTKTAKGVVFITNKRKFFARAANEVIVSAGAINSPQLLMLSGIGPKNHLNELNIPVIADLPVGKHLKDHPLFHLYFHTNMTLVNTDLKSQIKSYLEGTGPLTTPTKFEGLGFINTGNKNKNIPLLEYILVSPTGNPSPALTEKVFNFNEETLKSYIQQVDPKKDFIIFLVLLHEKSQGTITLKSSNPLDFPNIDLNYFDESEDVDNIIEGVKYVLKVTETEAFRKINTTLVDIGFCNDFEKYTHEFWGCVVRHLTSTTHHLSGTTVMGNDRLNSVVNVNLEVHGISKLRVVDAGIFPTSLSAHTNAPTIMVAEKISDVIKLIQQYTTGNDSICRS